MRERVARERFRGAGGRESARERVDTGTRFRGYSGAAHVGINRWVFNRREISYFFYNFPEGCEVEQLWRTFKRCGKAVDIYMARKRLKNGQQFGFIRFLVVGRDISLERNLSNVWIGHYKLKIFLADRGRATEKKVHSEGNRSRSMSKNNKGWDSNRDDRSFADVVRTGNNPAEEMVGINEKRKQKEDSVEHHVENVVGTWISDEENSKYLEKCLVGRISSLDNIEALSRLVSKTMDGCSLKYLGGRQMLIYFQDSELLKSVVENTNHGIHYWVKELSRWSAGFRASERVTWIRITGVPLHGWNEKVFSSIAEKWGLVLKFRNCNFLEDYNLCGGKVMICTHIITPINEVGAIKVGNFFYRIAIVEEENMVNMEDLDFVSESTMESESDDSGGSDSNSEWGSEEEDLTGRESGREDEATNQKIEDTGSHQAGEKGGTPLAGFDRSSEPERDQVIQTGSRKINDGIEFQDKVGGDKIIIEPLEPVESDKGREEQSSLKEKSQPFYAGLEELDVGSDRPKINSDKPNDKAQAEVKHNSGPANNVNPSSYSKEGESEGLKKMPSQKSKTRIAEPISIGRGKMSIHLMKRLARNKHKKTSQSKEGKPSHGDSKKDSRKGSKSKSTESEGSMNSLRYELGSKEADSGIRDFGEKLGILSLNVRGLGAPSKKSWVRELVSKVKPDILGIQETKLKSWGSNLSNQIWGAGCFDSAVVDARGNSGGIATIWNKDLFSCNYVVEENEFLAIIGAWSGRDELMGFVNVYGPNSTADRKVLWSKLQLLLSKEEVNWCVFGDFNEVRNIEERLNCGSNQGGMEDFNNFISDSGLVEVPLFGRRFTRVSDDGTKFSKLDRFLISDSFGAIWRNLGARAIERNWSDHTPILLDNSNVDFGPRPFKFFNAWLKEDSIDGVVRTAWAIGVNARKPDRILVEKLKNVKTALKEWNKKVFGKLDSEISSFKEKMLRLEKKAEREGWLEDEQDQWLEARRFKFSKEEVEKPSLRGCNFKKISSDDAIALEATFGEEEVWEAIKGCGSNKSPGPDGFTFGFVKRFWSLIKGDVLKALHWFWDKEDISAGCNAAFITLIPKVKCPEDLGDFRPISLIGVFYKIVAKVLAERLKKVIDKLISPTQTAFIKKRQILDGALIANEMVEFLRKKKQSGLIFKVDFEKAYDSVDWDCLLGTLARMGFGKKWIGWIQACLRSSTVSILLNGSPTKEFRMGKGLRQGDPMAPFLFLIVAENLNLLMEEAVDKGLYHGIKVGNEEVIISHLQFADDAIFFGEWSLVNLKNLLKILECFRLLSGMKINMRKSKLYGVNTCEGAVEAWARGAGCLGGELPFTYLGIPVGASMRKLESWKSVIEKLKGKLSSWKAKLISFGGRLTLVKSVLGSTPLYLMSLFRVPRGVLSELERVRKNFFWGGGESGVNGKRTHAWVNWNQTVSSFDKGGLAIGSLSTMNQALLAKWWWRSLSENGALWLKVIKSVYGACGGLDGRGGSGRGGSSVWGHVLGVVKELDETGLNFSGSFRRVVGEGKETSFWMDRWIGNSNLFSAFPRLARLELNLETNIAGKGSWVGDAWVWNWSWRRCPRGREVGELEELENLLSGWYPVRGREDKWEWSNSSDGGFSTKKVREMLGEGGSIGEESGGTLWCSAIPRKVNVFMWRARLGRLPTRSRLDKMGVDIDSILCPRCGECVEDVDHALLKCEEIASLWSRVKRWWNITSPLEDSLSQFLREDAALLKSSKGNHGWVGLKWCFLYLVWHHRNKIIFSGERSRVNDIFFEWQRVTFEWMSCRIKDGSGDWFSWLAGPQG
ncbi:hypothetical protein OSB04_026084 [Centaurea solstitialis]|uniref:Reverse transcriptase domain-containing protein n=1 Tax=Centaurea solstitialis TaxID=347529 RepID=A0AA38SC27_9ASTR|nr:hypothetical protein OSB04_026084 [Centaurea solstitialis]